MNRILTLLVVGLSSTQLLPQTVLFSETFEQVPSSFTLNTTDAGSTAGGDNTWIINNAYTGGSGSIVCLGFPFSFTVPTVAGQPGGITDPNGAYMHISSQAALNSGINCASFVAADGLCSNAANHFTRMTADISTLGQSDVTLSFWWLCGGGTNNYGEVYYSTNGGANWILLGNAPTQYRNQLFWVQQTITLPAFEEQATLRFGFRFVNGVTLSAQDPGFAVDDVIVSSAGAPAATVATSVIAPNSYCAGASITVPFSVTGSFDPGNIFTAQLSDAAGSFTAPTALGSLAATGSGSIAGTIPGGTPAGSGYRVRVIASAPATSGTESLTTLTISAPPSAGVGGTINICANTGIYDLYQLLGGSPSACGAWQGPSGSPFSGMFNSATDAAGSYVFTTNCPGPCPQDAATLMITVGPAPNAGADVMASRCASTPPASLFELLDGGDPNGSFSYQGAPVGPSILASPGVYELEYVVQGVAPCVNDTAQLVINVFAPPQAGTSTTLTVCVNASPVSLITLLGQADPGGSWTGPGGGVHSGMLQPSTDVSGIYTYYIQGQAPCPDAQAFVAVEIDPCTGIHELPSELTIRWLGQDQEGSHILQVGGRTISEFQIADASGRAVQGTLRHAGSGMVLLDLDAGSGGVYLIRLRSEQGLHMLRVIDHGR